MSLAEGTKLGPYEIIAPLGAGGMGEVYRARDTRLDRTVAIKVLNSALVASPELRARFEREARVVSQLQHPHICVLHDIGNEAGTDFLVMEFLDGESLAERLKRGPLALGELLTVAIQLADALERAHKAGIVHRDLKPGNVMLIPPRGTAKLLDFGLAKPLAAGAAAKPGSGSSASVFSAAMTMTSPAPSPAGPLSTAGAVLGTVQYMSPEQIQGIEADARSDIFAFGLLLFEMATGKRAFEGKTQANVVGQILAVEAPAVSMLRPELPPGLDRVIRLCLEKDPDERMQCVHDLKLQLQALAESERAPKSKEVATAPASGRTKLLMAAAAVVLVAIAAAGTAAVEGWLKPKPHPVIASMTLPGVDSRYGVALSPDGRYFAYSAGTTEQRRLVIRSMESGAMQQYESAVPPSNPAWSPDGRYVFFQTLGKLRKFDVTTGAAYDLGDGPDFRVSGSAWMPDATILIGGQDRGILKISATGGTVTTLIPRQGAALYRHPVMVDTKHFLFNVLEPGRSNRLMLATSDGKDVRELALGADGGTDYANGYVLFTHGDNLMAASLSAGGVLGEPVHIADHVRGPLPGGRAFFTAAQDGTLAFEIGEAAAEEMVVFDAAGKSSGLALGRGAFNNPRFSPDGKLLAYDMADSAGNRDVWVYNLALKQATRFSLGGRNSDPVWSPDGKQIAYTRQVPGSFQIVAFPANGGKGEQVLASDQSPIFGRDWSWNGQFFVYDRFTSAGTNVSVAQVGGSGAGAEYIPAGGFQKHAPRFSPDGKWIVYQSNESGQSQIYLESFPERTGRWQVSTAGGLQPRWSSEGRHIFFLSPDDKLMSAEIGFSAAGPQVNKITEMFPVPPSFLAGGNPLDVTRDGSHFVLNTRHQDAADSWTVLLNWTSMVKK